MGERARPSGGGGGWRSGMEKQDGRVRKRGRRRRVGPPRSRGRSAGQCPNRRGAYEKRTRAGVSPRQLPRPRASRRDAPQSDEVGLDLEGARGAAVEHLSDDTKATGSSFVHTATNCVVEEGAEEGGDGIDEGAEHCDRAKRSDRTKRRGQSRQRTIRAELAQVWDQQRSTGVRLERVG